MSKINNFSEEEKFLHLLEEESQQDLVGFYDSHILAKKYHLEPRKLEPLLSQLQATRTHFSPTGIKTKKSLKEILKILKNFHSSTSV